MKTWYSYKGVPYKGNNPAFYDLAHLDWFSILQENLLEIKKSALTFLEKKKVESRQYINPIIVGGKSYWEVLPFMFWGQRDEQAIAEGMELVRYFEHIPGLVSLSFSTLMPKTHLKPHYGDTDGIYRLHIPLVVPAALPECGLRVNGIDISWDEKSIIPFCDAHLHEAWNDTEEPRIILIVDAVKENFLHKQKQICYNVRSLLALQQVYLKWNIVYVFPGPLKGVIRHLLKWTMQIKGRVFGI